MKKIRYDSKKDVDFRKRYQKRKWERDLARRAPQKKKRPKSWKTYFEKPIFIQLPPSFDVFNNSTHSIGAINELRSAGDAIDQRTGKKCRLDFRELESLEVASALVLMAEIDIWHLKYGQELVAHTHIQNFDIYKSLRELGLFGLVKLRGGKRLAERLPQNRATFLEFVRGQGSDGTQAKKLRKDLEATFKLNFDDGTKKKLYAALTEAFTNAHRHAYQDGKLAYWWLAAAYDQRKKVLTIAVYDRGLGIPETMEKKGVLEKTRKLVRTAGVDGDLIEKAVESSFSEPGNTRTRTGQPYHGHGLKQIAELATGGGKIRIVSLRGYCIFSIDNGELTHKNEAPLGARLQGTLIEWTMKIGTVN